MSNKLEKFFQVATLAAGLSVMEGCYGQGDDCDLISNNPELDSVEMVKNDCAEVKKAVYTCLLKDKSDSSEYTFKRVSLSCEGAVLKGDATGVGNDGSYCVRGKDTKLSCNF